jgi:hypothetical protein
MNVYIFVATTTNIGKKLIECGFLLKINKVNVWWSNKIANFAELKKRHCEKNNNFADAVGLYDE